MHCPSLPTLSPHALPLPAHCQVTLEPGSTPSDEQLCRLLLEHLGLDATAHFSEPQPAASGRSNSTHPHAARPAGGAGPRAASAAKCSVAVARPQEGLEDFVARTRGLLELERQAEVDQATEATTLCSPETAQVGRGGGRGGGGVGGREDRRGREAREGEGGKGGGEG